MLKPVRMRSRQERLFATIARNTAATLACILATGIAGCSCQKTDEEILKKRLDTAKVHLYLASKIALMKSNEPEGKKVRDQLLTALKASKGSKSTPTGPHMNAKDVLTLVGSLYSLKSEGKELLHSGNEKGMKPVLPLIFEPNADLSKVLDLNLEHAFLLTGLFAAKFHPDTKIPVPDEIALYEAWMTNADQLPLDGLMPLVRAMKSVLYANNELCDLAGKEAAGVEKDANKLTDTTLGSAFSTINGSTSSVTGDQAKYTLAAARGLTHAFTGLCYKKRDKGDDEKKIIDELDGFLKAADDMGIRTSETVFIRAYVSIRRDDREGAKRLLETVRDDPQIDATTKADIDKLVTHLNDDSFISGYFDRIYFIKTTTIIVLRRLDEVGAFDPIKESALVNTINAYIGTTSQSIEHAKESVSKEALEEKLKALTKTK